MKSIGLMTKVSATALMLAAGLMTGCDSNSSSGKSAIFIDSPVSGISYTTSSDKEGVTDEDGKFSYKSGDTITFSIGDLGFPSGEVQEGYITPAHLAGDADWENSEVAINIIQMLLSLDEDQDPDNGIQITEALIAAVNTVLDGDGVTWTDTDFDDSAAEFIGLVSVELDVTLTYVDEETATTHFTASIEGIGLDIEIEVSTEASACDSSNTADIQGDYSGSLVPTGEPTYNSSVEINVVGTDLTVNSDDISASSCTYAHTSVTEPIAIDTDTWVWTVGTSDTFSLVKTSGIITFTTTEDNGLALATGSVTAVE